jgi:DNA-binding Lrp family transcriptional regulator
LEKLTINDFDSVGIFKIAGRFGGRKRTPVTTASGPTDAAVVVLSSVEKKLVHLLSGDLGSSPRPYAELADKLGWSETRTLEAIESLFRRGAIRRLGAVAVHQRAGFSANAMVVWRVDETVVEEAGKKLAALPYVTHCYQRRPAPGWPYNLYAMIHAASLQAVSAMVEEMAGLAGSSDWRVLESLRELKKTSLRYFPSDSSQE